MMIGFIIAILLLLLYATTTPVANAFCKLPPMCEEQLMENQRQHHLVRENQQSC